MNDYSEEELIDQLLHGIDEDQRRDAAAALGEQKAVGAVEALLVALRQDQDEYVRGTAAWALGEIRATEAFVGLVDALHDNGFVWSHAADALGELGNPSAIQPLLDTYLRMACSPQEIDPFLLAYVPASLSKFGAAALDALLSEATNPEPRVRMHVAWATGFFGEHEQIKNHLLTAMNDSDFEVQEWVVYELLRYKDLYPQIRVWWNRNQSRVSKSMGQLITLKVLR